MIDESAGSKSTAMIAQVLKLEKELARMKIALGVEGVKTPKKARKAKDPSAPKRESPMSGSSSAPAWACS